MNSEATDKRTWSGTPYHIWQELIKYCEVELLNIKVKNPFLLRFCFKVEHILFRKNNMPEHTAQIGRLASRQLNKYIMKRQVEYKAIILVSGALAYEKINIPICYIADAVFQQMIDYYWFNLTSKNITEGNELQKRALENATKIILASNWAKEEAIKSYQIDEKKIEIIHLGASVSRVENKIEHENINILFCGVDYYRKGGGL